MTEPLFLDFETYSEVPIKHGTYKYAENAEIMIATYALGDGPVKDIDFTLGIPEDVWLLQDLVGKADLIIAHNAMFDRNVLRLGNLETEAPITKWRCSMVKALEHGLPGSLDKLCEILKVPQDLAKLKDGRALVHLFCKPLGKNRKLNRATRETHPDQWARFIEYAKNDISAMREVWNRLPSWNYGETGNGAVERDLWHLDQKINDRGVLTDQDLVTAAIRATDAEQARLKKQIAAETDDYVGAATQRDRLLDYIFAEYGVGMADMSKSSVAKMLDRDDIDPQLRSLLEIRAQASRSSTAKYKSFQRAANSDGRVRGMLQFSGAARTRRDAGRTVQLQNLPSRGLLPQDQVEIGIEAMKFEAEDLVFDDIMRLTSSTVRSVIVAPPGKKLVVSDLSNIEGRGLAWLAGEEWKLQAFRDFDTIVGHDMFSGEPVRVGPDLYKLAYANMFATTPDQVDKFGRSIGKVAELACFAAETKVLTSNGVKAILVVSKSDLLWDGETWVKHEGVVERNARQTVNVDGINLTPDHLILTGETWIPAQELASSGPNLFHALATGSANLPSLGLTSAPPVGVCMSGSLAPAAALSGESTYTTFEKALRLAATTAQKWLRGRLGKNTTVTPTSSRTRSTGLDCSAASPRASIAAAIRMTAATRTTAVAAYVFGRTGRPIAALFSRTLSRWLAGTFRNSSLIGSTLIEATSRATYGLSRSSRTSSTAAPCADSKTESENLRPVFDILNAGPRNRFTVVSDSGYLIAHNCGYAGGINAFVTFSLAYGMDLEQMATTAWDTIPDDVKQESLDFVDWLHDKGTRWPMSNTAAAVCESFKRMWRNAHPMTVALWRELEDGFRAACKRPGHTFQYRQFKFRRDGAWLRIQLPSGRCLCYPHPRIEENGDLTFMGVNQFTRKWERIKTYGGKLTENACQGTARDFMFDALPGVEQGGYEITVRVHDEVVTEAPDTPKFNAEHLSGLLATTPPWGAGMPLAAAGFEGYRYKKD